MLPDYNLDRDKFLKKGAIRFDHYAGREEKVFSRKPLGTNFCTRDQIDNSYRALAGYRSATGHVELEKMSPRKDHFGVDSAGELIKSKRIERMRLIAQARDKGL